MWFKNLQLYRLPKNWAENSDKLAAQLATKTLQPCAASDLQSIGWVPPRAGGPLVHAVNRQWLLALGVEQKLLPAAVVKQFADEKAKAIEDNEGRRVGRKEMRELREALTIELLPRAFIRRRTTFAWIDPVNGWLVVDAAAPAKAEEFLEQLRKSVAGLPARLLQVTQSPSSAMTGWVAAGEAPEHFTLDQDLELRSAEKATVRYVKHTLEGDEIRQHIATGKVVTRLAMTWGERISFLLDENLQVKRLSFLDIVKDEADGQAENEDERFDIDFTLMSGEVARLLDDLLAALGGELLKEAATPTK
jgi:recombination associated protein RdgC